MLKLLCTIFVFLMLALGLLWLRMQRLELTAQTAQLRHEIELREHKLWGQEVAIAQQTNPPSLAAGLKNSGLTLTLPGTPSEALKAANKAAAAGAGAGGGGGAGGGDRDMFAPLNRTNRRPGTGAGGRQP